LNYDLAAEICAAINRTVQKRKKRGADIFDVLRYLDRLMRVWKSEEIREFILRLAICEMMKTIFELEGRHENQRHSKRA